MSEIRVKKGAAAGTPPSGYVAAYAKTDGRLYTKNDDGTESLAGVNLDDSITNGVTDRAPSQNAVFDALALKVNTSLLGAVSGVATLDGAGKVPSAQLPSYVDDVLEYANLAAFPVTGETGKIYLAIDTGLIYRWSGSIYVQVGGGSVVWGDITGSLSSQTDLQAALDLASQFAEWGSITGNLKDQNNLTDIVDGEGAYYFTQNASDLGGGRLEMTKDIPAGGGFGIPFTGVSDGDYLSSFCSVSGFPNTDHLPAGPLSFNIFAIQNAGTKVVRLLAEFYVREVGGSETLLGTSGLSEPLTGSNANVKAFTTMAPIRGLNTTDRLLIRIKASVSGAGTAPDITLNIQGSNLSRTKFPSEPYVAPVTISWGDIVGTLSDQTDLQTAFDGKQNTISAANNQLIYQNASSVIEGFPGLFREPTFGGLNLGVTIAPDDTHGGYSISAFGLNIEPTADAPSESVNLWSHYINLDFNNSGFEYGTNNGTAARIHANFFNHQGSGNVGGIAFHDFNFSLGNGTDPIEVEGFGYAFGFGGVNANTTITGQMKGYGFQPSFDAASAIHPTQGGLVAFYDYTNGQDTIFTYYNSFDAASNLGGIANNANYQGFRVSPNIGEMQGNSNFFAFLVNGNVASPTGTGSWNGVYVNPQSVQMRNAWGVWVSMDGVTVFAGVKASVTIQDLFYEAEVAGEDPGNTITIEYTPGATAGAEVVSNVGPAITVQIEDGVSTATQVKAALDAYGIFAANANVTISGSGSNPQTVQGPTNFAGGEWPGQKKAAFFDGDVEITGALSFNGSLNVGKFNAFATQALADGGGQPGSVHTLITQPTVAANVTVANADLLGVNTAALISIGNNAVVTTAFLGVAALGLPAVLSMGTGSSIDKVAGAVFALSLDASGTGGTVDTVALCRSLAIPNGVTTVNRLYGYEVALPFGDPATDSWGIYAADGMHNWMKGSLRLGGTALIDDTADSGFKLHIEGDSKLEGALAHLTGNVGFFGTTPVSQPASSGAATAGFAYTATEQTMLQEVYDAVRSLGLMS